MAAIGYINNVNESIILVSLSWKPDHAVKTVRETAFSPPQTVNYRWHTCYYVMLDEMIAATKVEPLVSYLLTCTVCNRVTRHIKIPSMCVTITGLENAGKASWVKQATAILM